jgi:hypothetical protein
MGNPPPEHRQEDDATHMAELEGDLAVAGMEQVLHRRLVGTGLRDQRFEGVVQVGQPLVKGEAARRHDGSEGEGPEPVGPTLDEAVTGRDRAGIDPQNEHAVRKPRAPR